MKLVEITNECQIVFVVEETGEEFETLTESVIKQFGREGMTLKAKYRCLSGPKAGKLVDNPSDCNKRKDFRRVKIGRKVMRTKGKLIHHKSEMSKKKSISKVLTHLNQRLSGTHNKHVDRIKKEFDDVVE